MKQYSTSNYRPRKFGKNALNYLLVVLEGWKSVLQRKKQKLKKSITDGKKANE
jgi:hypothetical protein